MSGRVPVRLSARNLAAEGYPRYAFSIWLWESAG